jgi:hypothetical protein
MHRKEIDFDSIIQKEENGDVELYLNFCFGGDKQKFKDINVGDVKKIIFSQGKELWGELSIIKLALKNITQIDGKNLKLKIEYKQLMNFVMMFFIVKEIDKIPVRIKMKYSPFEVENI